MARSGDPAITAVGLHCAAESQPDASRPPPHPRPLSTEVRGKNEKPLSPCVQGERGERGTLVPMLGETRGWIALRPRGATRCNQTRNLFSRGETRGFC